MAGNFTMIHSDNPININTPPTISAKSWTILENSPKDTIIGNMLATDIESPDSLSYKIITGNDSNIFSID